MERKKLQNLKNKSHYVYFLSFTLKYSSDEHNSSECFHREEIGVTWGKNPPPNHPDLDILFHSSLKNASALPDTEGISCAQPSSNHSTDFFDRIYTQGRSQTLLFFFSRRHSFLPWLGFGSFSCCKMKFFFVFSYLTRSLKSFLGLFVSFGQNKFLFRAIHDSSTLNRAPVPAEETQNQSVMLPPPCFAVRMVFFGAKPSCFSAKKFYLGYIRPSHVLPHALGWLIWLSWVFFFPFLKKWLHLAILRHSQGTRRTREVVVTSTCQMFLHLLQCCPDKFSSCPFASSKFGGTSRPVLLNVTALPRFFPLLTDSWWFTFMVFHGISSVLESPSYPSHDQSFSTTRSRACLVTAAAIGGIQEAFEKLVQKELIFICLFIDDGFKCDGLILSPVTRPRYERVCTWTPPGYSFFLFLVLFGGFFFSLIKQSKVNHRLFVNVKGPQVYRKRQIKRARASSFHHVLSQNSRNQTVFIKPPNQQCNVIMAKGGRVRSGSRRLISNISSSRNKVPFVPAKCFI